MLYSGEGEAGVYGGPSGDLYVVLHCKEHEFFEREGKDLRCVVPISFVQAALGTEINVPTLEGEHTLKVPEGTQTAATFKLRNKGVPELNGRGRGDLYVELKVQTPTKLSKAPARTAGRIAADAERGEQAGQPHVAAVRCGTCSTRIRAGRRSYSGQIPWTRRFASTRGFC